MYNYNNITNLISRHPFTLRSYTIYVYNSCKKMVVVAYDSMLRVHKQALFRCLVLAFSLLVQSLHI